MFTIASVNVNGIRAAYRREMGQWLETAAPDVLLLQEVRAPEGMTADLLGPGWHIAEQASVLKGRSGVAIASRVPLDAQRTGVARDEPDVDTGRWIEADLTTPAGTEITVVSAYLHSGQVGSPKLEHKMAHLAAVEPRLKQMLQNAQDGGRQTVVAGDFNIVHTERDIKNWRGNYNKTSGVLQSEIDVLDRWFNSGWVDTARALNGEEQGPYTWWSWRGKAFDNDAGWRIDYQMATPALAARAAATRVDRAETYEQRFSDHAPLIVQWNI